MPPACLPLPVDLITELKLGGGAVNCAWLGKKPSSRETEASCSALLTHLAFEFHWNLLGRAGEAADQARFSLRPYIINPPCPSIQPEFAVRFQARKSKKVKAVKRL